MDATPSALSGLNGQQWKQQMLASGASKAEQANQLAMEFEGVLLRQFLDEALKPMDPENGFFGASGSPMYDQLIKDSLASGMTKAGSLGFSSVLQAQLFPETLNAEKGLSSHE